MMHGGSQLLRQHGFELVFSKGGHKVRHPDGRKVILPFCASQYPAKPQEFDQY